MTNALDHLVSSLSSIGIECRMDPDANGFLERVRISQGAILYRPDASISNILHEAGHLACIPPAFRDKADGDLDALAEEMCEYVHQILTQGADPDLPIVRAIIQCSDSEATAWAWAFGAHIGLEPEQIIENEDYQNEGHIVRLQVSTGRHLGVNGLRAAGMIDSTKNWPHLTKWVQDAREE